MESVSMSSGREIGAQFFFEARAALISNMKPGLLLQLFAVGLIVLYFWIPSLSPVFIAVMDLKREWGLLYSAVATSFFAGILPVLILLTLGRTTRSQAWSKALVYSFFWMWKGVEADLFYRAQAFLFGDDGYLGTIIKKVLFDQFIYNPVWAAPNMIIFYTWVNSNFSCNVVKNLLKNRFFTKTLPITLLSTWMVWIPATMALYSLPLVLQIPVFNLILCFWVLVLDLLSRKNIRSS
jgi:hypothetical protein